MRDFKSENNPSSIMVRHCQKWIGEKKMLFDLKPKRTRNFFLALGKVAQFGMTQLRAGGVYCICERTFRQLVQ